MLSTYEILQTHRARTSATRTTTLPARPVPMRLDSTQHLTTYAASHHELPPVSVWHELVMGASVLMGCLLMLSLCMLPTYAAIAFAIDDLSQLLPL